MAGNDARFSVLSGDVGAAETAAERVYGGPLRFPVRPTPHVVANFVSSIDGVVSLGLHDGTDSSSVSGHHAGDRYLMAMLRSAADAVLIGAGTLRASVGHQWTPAAVAPKDLAAEGALSLYRSALGRPSTPAPLAIVTGSGQLPSHVALTQPATEVLVLTSNPGRERVAAAFPHVRVEALGEAPVLDGAEIVAAVQRHLGARLILTEGGPSLTGSLLAGHALHELFWTVSPAIAGRDPSHPRLALINQFVARPGALRPAQLLSVRRWGEHLFLRYQFDS